MADRRIADYIEKQYLENNTCVDETNGELVKKAGFITNYIPVQVHEGDVIRPVSDDTVYSYSFYSDTVPDSLIYTYSYSPDSNWTTFNAELSDFQWSARERSVRCDGFIRITVKVSDGDESLHRFDDLFSIEKKTQEEYRIPEWMKNEAELTAEKVKTVRKPDDAVFLLLADTHYATGCTWNDTRGSLQLVYDMIGPSGIIHLGDFTDGLMPCRHTEGISSAVVSELHSISDRVFACVGNHDKNRFRGNPNGMSDKECASLYLGRKKPWYYIDLPENKLRLIFLDSFDPDRKERYGFSRREVLWLRSVLFHTPEDHKVLMLSHVTPIAELHVWSSSIRNGERILRALERFQRRRRGSVLGWIHGHSHADQIWTARSFPIIGIGCSKLESFQEHKPEGSVTWPRKKDGPSQELWDVLVVHADDGRMDFIRFGSGEDRVTHSNV